MNGEKLNSNLLNFISHLDSIRDTLPMTILLLDPYRKKSERDLEKFQKEYMRAVRSKDEYQISLLTDQYDQFKKLQKNARISNLAHKIIPQSLYVSLISQFDAFLNNLLKAIFEISPKLLNNSERQLTFAQIVELGSVEKAREYIVEKEIETVLRKSHTEHFDYLEKKLDMSLRKNLKVWSTFIEITERRNLFVHCDGIISNQYMKVCSENGCDLKNIKVGDGFAFSSEHFLNTYKCLYEIAVKLTHTIWRKMLKNDMENADHGLNSVCYDLLNETTIVSSNLSDILLDFACSQVKFYSSETKYVFIVNRAISKHLRKDLEGSKAIINAIDWSASSNNFKLAHSILVEDYEKAYDIMLKIGYDGDVPKSGYKQWPLFKRIREEEKFKQTFKEIFNEEYTILEEIASAVQGMVESKQYKRKSKLTVNKDQLKSEKRPVTSLPNVDKVEKETTSDQSVA